MSLSPAKRANRPTSGLLQRELRQTKPFASLTTEAFLNLVRTTDQLQRTLRLSLKPYGVTETQYNSLRILRGAGEHGLTCSEIGERLISQDPDITRLLDRMEKQGLVHRERDTKDRRVVITRITRQGLTQLKELDQVVTKTVTALLGHLGENELLRMIALLERVREHSG